MVLNRLTASALEALAQRGVAHGFFGRAGGVSEGIYASLNTGYGSGDAAESVAENRRRITESLGAEALCTAFQIHSARVAVVESAWAPASRCLAS